jgi:hypothetical protein
MRFICAWQMYKRIPMKATSILPDEGFPPRHVEITEDTKMSFRVYCKPKPKPGQRWGHRIMVECTCGKDVPFGRMSQHFGKTITCKGVNNVRKLVR